MAARSDAPRRLSRGGFAAWLSDGRLRLVHGPIDLIVEARARPGAEKHCATACGRAVARFDGLLQELVDELPMLRRAVSGATPPALRGPCARRMVEAVWPHRAVFVTPMAAVAGAVADELLAAIGDDLDLALAYVNDGGDIAFRLAPGECFRAGIVADVANGRLAGVAEVRDDEPVRGCATSGRGGRSHSLGIADAVTVLARTAAAADAAATLIADAVDLPGHPAVERRPAWTLDPDSDLGDRPVTVAVGRLGGAEIAAALDAGAAAAAEMRVAGLIAGAHLMLAGERRIVGGLSPLPPGAP